MQENGQSAVKLQQREDDEWNPTGGGGRRSYGAFWKVATVKAFFSFLL